MTPPAELSEADDAIPFAAGPLVLLFRWRGDRWTHALERAGGEGLVARAVEWEDGRDDPDRVINPVLQAGTHHEVAPGGSRILLLGRWARYTGSCAVRVDREGEGSLIEWDVAARSQPPPLSVAATYDTAFTSSDLADAGPAGVEWHFAGGRLRFETGPGAGRVVLAEAGRAATRVQALADLKPGEATQRLFYRWRWLPT